MNSGEPSVADAVVVAAGQARRMQREDGKALLALCGKPLIAYSLQALEACARIRRVVVVVRAADVALFQDLIDRNGWTKCRDHIVPGGAERFHSVRNGLSYVSTDPAPLVAIHDAARPFLSQDLLERSIQAADDFGAAVVAVPAVDTVKRSEAPGFLHSTLPRRTLWQVQTPQTFRFDLIWPAYANASEETAGAVTDDADLLERQGVPIRIVEGSRYNLKVTVPEDVAIAETLLRML